MYCLRRFAVGNYAAAIHRNSMTSPFWGCPENFCLCSFQAIAVGYGSTMFVILSVFRFLAFRFVPATPLHPGGIYPAVLCYSPSGNGTGIPGRGIRRDKPPRCSQYLLSGLRLCVSIRRTRQLSERMRALFFFLPPAGVPFWGLPPKWKNASPPFT